MLFFTRAEIQAKESEPGGADPPETENRRRIIKYIDFILYVFIAGSARVADGKPNALNKTHPLKLLCLLIPGIGTLLLSKVVFSIDSLRNFLNDRLGQPLLLFIGFLQMVLVALMIWRLLVARYTDEKVLEV